MREKFPLKEIRSVLYSSVLESGLEEVGEVEGVRGKEGGRGEGGGGRQVKVKT